MTHQPDKFHWVKTLLILGFGTPILTQCMKIMGIQSRKYSSSGRIDYESMNRVMGIFGLTLIALAGFIYVYIKIRDRRQ